MVNYIRRRFVNHRSTIRAHVCDQRGMRRLERIELAVVPKALRCKNCAVVRNRLAAVTGYVTQHVRQCSDLKVIKLRRNEAWCDAAEAE